MIFHSPLLNILINLISVGKYNFFNWGTFVPQGTVYGVFLMGTVPGLTKMICFEKLLCIVFVKPRLTPRTTNHARTSKMTVSGLVIQITIV
jgi:uncharacterized membrane protein